MVSFIDDVIVEIEEEEKHDEVVEEVVKRLAENNLYIKLEKCKWRAKKVGFLEVVIELKEIKIEQEKLKIVLDWLVSKEVRCSEVFRTYQLLQIVC